MSITAAEHDVVMLEWEGGIVELVRVGDLTRKFGEAMTSPTGEIVLPTQRVLKRPVRGERSLGLDAVQHLAVDITQTATDCVAPIAIRKIEETFVSAPDLYHLSKNGELVAPFDANAATAEPYLVLVHGTFASTATTFGDLFKSPDWTRLYDEYTRDTKGHVLAFEHRTVTESPLHNAKQLVDRLPNGARLHLLTHSRGGLVGDLLCRGSWENEEADRIFAAPEYERHRQELAELKAALFAGPSPSKVTVERFVRVAAPAAGTQLAGPRLDRFLNVFLTLLGRLAAPGSIWFDFVKAIAVQIVAQRTRAEVCPGLEAMMPDRALVRFLNLAKSDGRELAAISGDVADARWFQLLKEAFFDFYFGHAENDFVVDTASMTRGVQRKQAWIYLHQGPKADHLSYFQDETIRRLAARYLAHGETENWSLLVRAPQRDDTRGLLGLDAAQVASSAARPDLPTVLILPGIMGTRLGQGSDLIWIDPIDLATGGMKKLRYQAQRVDGIVPQGLIEKYYENLALYLSRDFNVRLFAYDWRQPIAASANQLGPFVDQALMQTQKPVCILAHSMGGLVTRAFIRKNPDQWGRLKARGGRLVMLGTPNFGSFAPAQVITGEHSLVNLLAFLDASSSRSDLIDVVKGFPGLLEMLPRHSRLGYWLDNDQWERFGPARPDPELLNQARQFREDLDTQDTSADGADGSMVYVAGLAKQTPTELRLEHGSAKFYTTRLGDGVVPWELGRLPGVPTYYVQAEHGELANHKPSFAGYVELLRQGKTSRLAATPPTAVRDVDARTEQLSPLDSVAGTLDVAVYPSENDVIASVIGAAESDATSIPLLRLSVVNGDITRVAQHPVLVGHYAGDPIASVERVLDRWLGGAMARDHALGIYPGPLGTMHCYTAGNSSDDTNRKVIVVGLGRSGALTGVRLKDVVRDALLRYAVDQSRCNGENGPLELSLVSPLIGSWGTQLTAEDSIGAIVTAIRECNARLERKDSPSISFVELTFVELFRDLATEAMRAIRRLDQTGADIELAERFLSIIEPIRRHRPSADRVWYRRVAINAEWDPAATSKEAQKAAPASAGVPDACLRNLYPDRFVYNVVTGLARADVIPREIQWLHIRALLDQAPTGDPSAATTLFQYLLPYDLMDEARDAPDLVLQLDRWTAQIPWELMTDQNPMGSLVRRGVLRTLQIESPRKPRSTSSRNALVIGEPAGPKPELPGARLEAEAVGQKLKGFGMTTTVLCAQGPDECFRALLAEEYDIVHIAAHGRFDENNPKHSGVVLDAGRLLTAREFQNLKATPSLVFLNCCHLGRVGLTNPGPWSASVAEELIRIGVGVVVVAGWAVSDHAAVAFAEALYEELLAGDTLMTAVRTARRKARDRCSDSDVTWGAYQVYGEPGFTLPDFARERSDAWYDHDEPLSPVELVERVTDLDVRISYDDLARTSAVAKLKELWSAAPEPWHSHGDVNHAFGSVYAKLGEYPAAIEHYARAACCPDAPLGTIEQLADTEAHLALHETDNDKSQRLFRSSIQRLCGLLAIPSSERWVVLGETLRRKADSLLKSDTTPSLRIGPQMLDLTDPLRWYAQIEDSHLNDPGWLIGAARDAYAQATTVKPEPDNLYHAVSVSVALVLATQPNAQLDQVLMQKARQNAAKHAAQGNDRGSVANVDLDMLEVGFGLRDQLPEASHAQIIDRAKQIAAAYREVFDRYRLAPSDRDSVLDHLSTLAHLAKASELLGVSDYFSAIADELGAAGT